MCQCQLSPTLEEAVTVGQEQVKNRIMMSLRMIRDIIRGSARYDSDLGYADWLELYYVRQTIKNL